MISMCLVMSDSTLDYLAMWLSLASHFGLASHSWALPIIKHEENAIVNLTYIDHEEKEKGGFLVLIPSH